MTTPLTGTVALITGSSSGIGAATARRLAAEGAAVALVARRRDRLEELAATITGAGGTGLVIEADVTSEQQAAAAVERTIAELGRLERANLVIRTNPSGPVRRMQGVGCQSETDQTCDRCGPAVRAVYGANRDGELYLCQRCANRFWSALCAQGWTIHPVGEHAPAP